MPKTPSLHKIVKLQKAPSERHLKALSLRPLPVSGLLGEKITNMTPIPAIVVDVDHLGDEYFITVQVGC